MDYRHKLGLHKRGLHIPNYGAFGSTFLARTKAEEDGQTKSGLPGHTRQLPFGAILFPTDRNWAPATAIQAAASLNWGDT